MNVNVHKTRTPRSLHLLRFIKHFHNSMLVNVYLIHPLSRSYGYMWGIKGFLLCSTQGGVELFYQSTSTLIRAYCQLFYEKLSNTESENTCECG